MTEIQKADPAARRRALAIVAATALGGVLVLLFAEPLQGPLRDWLLERPERFAQRLRWTLLGLGAATLAPAFLAAAYLWRVAGRAARAQQFPPPGFKVLSDTPVLRGAAALARARILRLLALGAGAAGVLLVFALWRLASMAGPATA